MDDQGKTVLKPPEGLHLPPLSMMTAGAVDNSGRDALQYPPQPQLQQQQQQQQQQQTDNAAAVYFLGQVKSKYAGENQKTYAAFLDLMKNYNSQRIETREVVAQVSELFRDAPELVEGFEQFLPPEYRAALQRHAALGADALPLPPLGTLGPAPPAPPPPQPSLLGTPSVEPFHLPSPVQFLVGDEPAAAGAGAGVSRRTGCCGCAAAARRATASRAARNSSTEA